MKIQTASQEELSQLEWDATYFGVNAWVYCHSHMRPHTTGWCSVRVDNKTLLEATDYHSAVKECRERGLKLYSDWLEEKRNL